MKSSSCQEMFFPSITSVLVLFFFLFSPIFSSKDFPLEHGNYIRRDKSKNMKLTNDRLSKINKPFVKSIKSPDGDVIDCVWFYLQPAFDLPELKENMSLNPPELPKGYDNNASSNPEIRQLWNSKGESCPNGTIPIIRTRPGGISISKFGKKISRKNIPTSSSSGHEHAIGYVSQGEYYGAKAALNVWAPHISNNIDFSLSQIWVISDDTNHPVNTIEAGWHACPQMHGDSLPRLFVYWTPDGYRSGCYNLRCPGFVQTSHKVALGGVINPISTYNGQQYDVAYMIWKDSRSGDWWLRVGPEDVGYWPKNLFPDLRDRAEQIQYGGEVYSATPGRHTSTQMGSGHFQVEGYKRAAFVRNMEVIDRENKINAVSNNLNIFADKPNCYGVINGHNNVWGDYIYFGGPGYNQNCP